MADNAKFFDNEETTETEEETIDMIKVGEDEYSQEDLSELVGLGKVGREAEEKFNVKLDKVWPNLQSTINEKKDLEKKLEELEVAAKSTETVPAGEDQDLGKQIIAEADKYGLVHKDNIQSYINETLSARDLLAKTEEVVRKADEDGNPKTTASDLLDYMANPDNPRDPEKAYKLMFESELDKIKEDKINSLKSEGMVTEDTSTAGSKIPVPKKITRHNLEEALKEHMRS